MTTTGEQTMALSPEAKKRKYKRDIEYSAEHTTRVVLNFNHKTDADILAYLGTVPNKQGLIKELIRSRISEEGFTYEQTD